MNDTRVQDRPAISQTTGNGKPTVPELHEEAGSQRQKADGAPDRRPSDSSEATKGRRRPWVWALVGVAALVAIGAGVSYYLYSLSYESTDDAFIEGHVVPISPRVAGHVAKVYVTDNQWVRQGDLLVQLDPSDFEARLAAAEASLSAARWALKSRSLGADVTQITSSASVEEATAAVEGVKANLETARAAVTTANSQATESQAQLAAAQSARKQAQADLEAAEAKLQRANTSLNRVQGLAREHAVSQDALEEAQANQRVANADAAVARQRIAAQEASVRQAEAAVAAATSGIRQAEAGVAAQQAALARAEAQRTAAGSAPKQVAQSRSQSDAAQADVARAEAEVRQARLNLSYTKIHAAISGNVTRKSVEQGAYVQTGQPLLALVDPAVWIVANFKETQLDQMHSGQPVSVTVDTHPGVTFAAHVDSIQHGSGARFSLLPPENATGNYVKVVQRVPVKIVFDDLKQVEQYGLGPGMSVVPTVRLAEPTRTSLAAAISVQR